MLRCLQTSVTWWWLRLRAWFFASLVENSYTFNILTGQPMHSASKKAPVPNVLVISITFWKAPFPYHYVISIITAILKFMWFSITSIYSTCSHLLSFYLAVTGNFWLKLCITWMKMSNTGESSDTVMTLTEMQVNMKLFHKEFMAIKSKSTSIRLSFAVLCAVQIFRTVASVYSQLGKNTQRGSVYRVTSGL